MGGMMDGYGMGGGFFGNFFGFGLIFLLLILAIVAIVIWMVKPGDSKDSGTRNSSSENHEGTLKSRLARGDISEEEYDRLKKKLNEN
ncbi:SHOCT domain-containing protein [Salimicrobium halophilum]|uniref:Putative membrane protein n=1 Tax=Salimicrobium halophilum TaxID=86666 RepID=A0A1G8TZX5_9BACI|nr:SHOCT domain-containing protein [Salimicrobium halophilum]SDJ46310.1 putative membrane protein [Salimicrobium halophilum]